MKKQKFILASLSTGLLFSTVAPTAGFAQDTVQSIEQNEEATKVTTTDEHIQVIDLSKGKVKEELVIDTSLQSFEYTDRELMSTMNAGTIGSMEQLAPILLEAHEQLKTTLTFTYTGDVNTFFSDLAVMRKELFLTQGNDYVHGVTRGYSAKILGNTVTLTLLYMSTAEQEKEVDKRIKEITAQIIKPGMSELEKVKAINDWILINTTYSKKSKASPHSLYALLFEGKAVCQAYALAAYRLLEEAGMEARYVTGDAGEPHAWNLVKVDEEWYKLDTTWNDPLGTTDYNVNTYKYFLITSAQLKESHTWEEDDYPKATSTKYSYFRNVISPTTIGDTIYYSNSKDNNKLYKLNYKTSENTKVSDTRAYYLTQYNDVIYFSNLNDSGYLSSYNTKTGEQKRLEAVVAEDLYMKDFVLYYKKGSKQLTYDLPLTEQDKIILEVTKAFNDLNPKSKTYVENVVNARKYYDALSDELKNLITGEQYAKLVEAESTTIGAQKVVKAIQAIETSKDIATVEVARKGYDELSKVDRKLVSNYKVLTAAEKSMKAAVQAVAAIKAINPVDKKFLSQVKKARKLYDKTGNLQSLVYNADDFLNIEKQALVFEKISKLKLNSAKLIAQTAEANEAYGKLASGDTSLITNKAMLDEALEAIKPSQSVVNMVAAVNEASILTLEQITAPRTAYDSLTKQQKKYVNNYKLLTAIEKEFKAVKTASSLIAAIDPSDAKFVAQVTKASKAYKKVPVGDQGLVAKKDLLALYESQTPVIEQINKLKETSGKLIEQARATEKAYKLLTDTTYVVNKEKLESLLKAIEPAEKVVEQIKALTTSSKAEDVQAVRTAYNDLTKQQQKYVTNAKVLTSLEKALK